jgi:hypothetical protein
MVIRFCTDHRRRLVNRPLSKPQTGPERKRFQPSTPAERQERLKLAERYKQVAFALFEYAAVLRCGTEWTGGCDLVDPDWIKSVISKALSNLMSAIDAIENIEKGTPGGGPFASGYGRWKQAVKEQNWRYLVQIGSNMLVTSTHLRSKAADPPRRPGPEQPRIKTGRPRKDRELAVLEHYHDEGISETDVLRAIAREPAADSDGYAFRNMARYYLLQALKKETAADVSETLRNRWKSARKRRNSAGKLVLK